MKVITLLAAALLAGAATQAPADEPDGNSLTVRYADLNLDREAGVASLYRRLTSAAKQVCAEHAGKTLVEKQAHAACIDQAITTAVARIGRPVVTDYVARQLGKELPGGSSRVAAQ